MNWRDLVKNSLRKVGYDVVRYPLLRYLRDHGVNLLLDVGANTGQYALEMRRLGYRGRIVSFEPLSSAFPALERNARRDAGWTAVQVALGRAAAESVLHVAGNSASSSLLEMLPRHARVAAASTYVGEETIRVRPLDALFPDFYRPGDRVFLKIDTQGYERQVLEGAVASLPHVAGLQLELSLTPLYEGQALLEEMIGFVRSLGFTPVWIEPGFKDPATQQLLQADGLFLRTDAPA